MNAKEYRAWWETAILLRYQTGKTMAEVAEDFGVTATTICNVLKRNGVAARSARRLGSTDEAEVCRLYLSGCSGVELAARYGCNHHTIYNALRRNGIESRSNSEAHRKYACDFGFFHSIDSESKAYWLGFVAADGSVYKNVVSVGLASKDRGHVLRFRAALKSEHPVRDYLNDGFPRSELSIGCEEMARDLLKNGVGLRKSLTHEWPMTIPAHLLRHYLRGYFDGDGGWTLSKPRNASYTRQLSFSLIGSWAFCEAAQRFLVKNAEVRTNKLKSESGGNMASMRYGGTLQATRIYHLLYDGASVWLPRKRDIAVPKLRWKRHCTPRPSIRALSPERAAEMKTLRVATGATHEELAGRFGISAASVSRILSGKTWVA